MQEKLEKGFVEDLSYSLIFYQIYIFCKNQNTYVFQTKWDKTGIGLVGNDLICWTSFIDIPLGTINKLCKQILGFLRILRM